MKLPRDVSGIELAHKLRRLGYQPLHQSGDHLKCRTERDGRHTEPIPLHRALKVGTLAGILRRIAAHHHLDVETLIKMLEL